MVTQQDIPCRCITYPCNCGGKKTQEIETDRVQGKPQKEHKARIRRIVFLGLVGGLIYLATRK